MRVVTLNAMPKPQTTVWFARQDYMEGEIADISPPCEAECGEWAINTLIKKKHMGPLEHPQIVFNVVGFPHSVVQQFRTHRTGCSFDVQSGRYTGKRFVQAADRLDDIELDQSTHAWSEARKLLESLFYLRPAGTYADRSGKHYTFEADRGAIIDRSLDAVKHYGILIRMGYSEEHARSVLPWDIVRQNFVLSCNLRSLLHFFAMRSSKEAQLECQWLCDLLMEESLKWAPEIMGYWKDKHYGKAFIAP